MSAATLAIRASHAARRRHSASIRDLRADRHPNKPHSGPLRPLRAVGGTLGHPLDRPSMALGRGGPACISPAAGLQRPVLDAVCTARRWSAPRTIRLTYRLCRQDCSLCDGVTNRRNYPSTKPGQLHSGCPPASDSGRATPSLRQRRPTSPPSEQSQPPRHSHLDCRCVLILIVARHSSYGAPTTTPAPARPSALPYALRPCPACDTAPAAVRRCSGRASDW